MKKKGPFHDDQCSQCTEKFVTYEDYKAHVESKHFGNWIHKCGHCKKEFEEESDLKSHLLTYHVQATESGSHFESWSLNMHSEFRFLCFIVCLLGWPSS